MKNSSENSEYKTDFQKEYKLIFQTAQDLNMKMTNSIKTTITHICFVPSRFKNICICWRYVVIENG